MNILGVKIDNLNHTEIIEKINSFLNDGKFHQISTVGPEFILEAQRNEEYKNILNNCDLNVADGMGIRLTFWRYGKKLKARFAGIDLMHEMLKMAEDKGLGVFLTCRKDGLSPFKETKEAILKMYPRLVIDGENIELAKCHSKRSGSVVKESNKIYDKIRSLVRQLADRDDKECISYKLILCNFGAPYQEIFLNSLKNDTIGIAMGVGGSFDFITGKVKRAPVFVRQIGLEWLWRLIQQPWEQKGRRLGRILNAVIIFPIKIIISAKGGSASG